MEENRGWRRIPSLTVPMREPNCCPSAVVDHLHVFQSLSFHDTQRWQGTVDNLVDHLHVFQSLSFHDTHRWQGTVDNLYSAELTGFKPSKQIICYQ